MQHFEVVHSLLPAAAMLPLNETRLRKITSLASCFLTYMAVRTLDQDTREWLVYDRLIVFHDLLHGSCDWLDYNHLFPTTEALK